MYADLCEPWPVIWCGDLSDINPAVTGHAVAASTEILWEATGRQFGNCSVQVRPCRRDCASSWPQDTVWFNGVVGQSNWGWPFPSLVNGVWLNLACGLCEGDCSCTNVSEVLLSERIQIIHSININGSVLPTGAYAVYDGQRLVRTDGGQWPLCQDWTVTGGDGAWVIDAVFGAPVSDLAQMANGELAREIALHCSGQACSLSPFTQKVTRQGVTMERVDFKQVVDDLSGLYLVAQFVHTYNPNKIRDRARAYSPDRMPHRLQG